MLAMPVAGVDPAELADTWTDSRAAGARLHEAIDIMAPRGAPVAAAAAGAVEKLFLSVPGGKTIYLRSEDRRRLYYYAHLESYRPGLAEGQRVNRAEIIGTVGSTGNANPEGPHLHFEIRTIAPSEPWYGASVAINPYPLLVGRAVH